MSEFMPPGISRRGGSRWWPIRKGALFYVMKPIPPEGGGESRHSARTLVGHCTWNELCAADLDAALYFYTRTFGWAVTNKPTDLDSATLARMVAMHAAVLFRTYVVQVGLEELDTVGAKE